MRLALAADVVSLTGIPSNPGSLANAKVALDIATTLIEEHIGTSLVLSSYQDFFSYKIPKYRERFAPVSLRLTAGFIKADSLTAYQSLTDDPITEVADGEELESLVYTLDLEKGIVKLLEDVTEGTETLLMAYNAGFEFEEDGELTEGEPVPTWMVNAAKQVAIAVIRQSPSNLASSKTNIYRDVQDAGRSMCTMLLNGKIRARMGMQFVDRSVVSAV